MKTELGQALESVARRFRSVRLWGTLALCWLSWAVVGAILANVMSRVGEGTIPDRLWLATFGTLAIVTGSLCVALALRSGRDPRWVARRIEEKHPDLDTGLLAALEIDSADGQLGFLQSAVIRHALAHGQAHHWDDTVPTWRVRGAQLAHVVALGALVFVGFSLLDRTRSRSAALAEIVLADDGSEIEVDPGDTELERGSPLLVVARFKGAVPPDAKLVVEDKARVVAPKVMTRSLEDPTFAGRVDSIATDIAYHIDYAGRSSKSYKVSVFEYPELQRTDAKLVFPTYTALEPKTVEDIRHVTAVEGTELTLSLRLNKDVAEAKLVDESGEAIALTPPTDDSHLYKSTLAMTDSKRYKLQLKDKEGRSNKLTSDLIVNVTRNRPAVVTMTAPSHDVRVSPVEELGLKAKLEDDFGVVRHGLSYTLAGQEPREITLEGSGPKIKKLAAAHLLDFEGLKAKPDQLITYFFWAEDIGPDGQPRRTDGDMFFAEVRHFEEIFRQGEQPPSGSAENEEQQGQGQNAENASKLAELQKEIINGTWKIIRRETSAKLSDTFSEDVKALRDGQDSAIEQAATLAETLTDAASKASLEQATTFMKDAAKQLNGATNTKALRTALVSEQSAYQALLKLRAREFNIIRSNSRQQQSQSRSAGSPSQRQLNQLELSNEENRYEEQSKAQQQKLSEREQQQQEDRQVNNRLRELARRQADLNERLKELQSALEAAKTEEARREIEQQLKRLRDQQQQVLRDTDELQERMEREENRDRMAEARQQMEQSREHVRQASEALEQGQVPKAITEGARASREMNDLREELRKGASNRFSEEMTEMREQARKLDDDQTKLTEQLEARNGEPSPNAQPKATLRDTGDRDQVRKGLQQQRERLDQLLDRMRNTVQDAEETEPLLAKGLYDTVRKAGDQKVPDELKIAEQLAGAGIDDDAAKSSQRASEGIKELRQGVESAAERVLGDETAALRRAQAELDELANQINREIAQAAGPEGQAPSGMPDSKDQPGQGQQSGQTKQQGQQSGRRVQQEQEPGEGRQPGRQGEQGQQPGEQQKGQRPGQQGQEPGQGQQPGQRGQQPGQQGQQPGEAQQGQQSGPRQQPGRQGGQGQQSGQGQQGQQPGQRGQGQPSQGNQPGQRQQGGQGGGGGQGGFDRVVEGLANNNARGAGPGNPITGEGFRQWSDRMREVEELLDNPELRSEAARIRDRVRGEREEFKRHSKEPDASKLKGLVAEPLNELRKRVAEEVRRRESPDALVPIDRDPVPPQFTEGVRRYYERLGSGR